MYTKSRVMDPSQTPRLSHPLDVLYSTWKVAMGSASPGLVRLNPRGRPEAAGCRWRCLRGIRHAGPHPPRGPGYTTSCPSLTSAQWGSDEVPPTKPSSPVTSVQDQDRQQALNIQQMINLLFPGCRTVFSCEVISKLRYSEGYLIVYTYGYSAWSFIHPRPLTYFNLLKNVTPCLKI